MQKITLESRLIFHLTLTATNPSCPRNTSNLTAFPHCFSALQEDFLYLFLTPQVSPIPLIWLPHFMFHGANGSHQTGNHSPSITKSINLPAPAPVFYSFPLLEIENVSFLLLKFKPCFGGSCLSGLLEIFTLSSSPLSPISSSLYFYPAVSIGLKTCSSAYF